MEVDTVKMIIPLTIAGIAAVAAVTTGRRRSLSYEVRKHTHTGGFQSHSHPPVTHEHQHTHVTHNRRQGPDMVLGEWEHLTSTHSHIHNHASLEHSHLPHQDEYH